MTFYIPRKIILSFLTVVFFCSTAWADIVKLTSGKTVEGLIIEKTSSYIKIDIGLGIPVTYYLTDVADITPRPYDLKEAAKALTPIDPKDIIGPGEVEAVVGQLQEARNLWDFKTLRLFIDDEAKIVIYEDDQTKSEYSKDEYMDLLKAGYQSVSQQTCEYMILNLERERSQARTIESVKQRFVFQDGQKVEITTKQKNIYQKKNGSIRLIYSEVNPSSGL